MPNVPPDAKLLTPADVAKIFKVSPHAVKRWCQKGDLPSVKTPSAFQYRIPLGEVRKLLGNDIDLSFLEEASCD